MISHAGTIALVEDNDDDLFFMKRALKAAEITNPLQAMGSGEEAIEYFTQQAKQSDRNRFPLPFLLLLDLKLPVMSGFEVLKWVRRHPTLHAMPIIVLTTSGESKDISKAYESGANSFLVKPSGSEELLDLVIALKQYWLFHNSFTGLATEPKTREIHGA